MQRLLRQRVVELLIAHGVDVVVRLAKLVQELLTGLSDLVVALEADNAAD